LFWWRTSDVSAFAGYWSSGVAISHGENPFVSNPLTGKTAVVVHGEARFVQDVNLNPPCVLLLFQLLSGFGLAGFGVSWAVLSAICLVTSVVLIVRTRPDIQAAQLLWLLLCVAVFDTITGAQIYFLLLLLATVAVVSLECERELLAAIAIGMLVAVKPTVVFWPLLAAASGRWRLAIRSLLTAAVVALLPILFYGRTVYSQWLQATGHDDHWMQNTDIAIPAYFARLGMPRTGTIVAAVAVICLLAAVRRLRPSNTVTAGIAICATILFSPLGWPAYSIMAIPAFVSRRWNALAKAAAILLATPKLVYVLVLRSSSITTAGVHGMACAIGDVLMLIYFLKIAADREPDHAIEPQPAKKEGDDEWRNAPIVVS